MSVRVVHDGFAGLDGPVMVSLGVSPVRRTMIADRAALAVALVISMLAATAPAGAVEIVLGGGFAKQCEDTAFRAADHLSLDPAGAVACDTAIVAESLSPHDLAATHVNRGILLLVRRQYAAAEDDFDAAIAIEPRLGGAYANRGAALIAQGQAAAGIAAIDLGLSMNSPEPEKAYYNRAIGREILGDLKGAYLDYLEASQLKPGWDEPARELKRFTVTSRRSIEG
jgi:tetratricopeptide (TPR) repeat protein